MTGVTVAIPAIAPRIDRLGQALTSVRAQTRLPDAILVEFDHDRQGPAVVRNRLLAKVATEWVAWLDDDDVLYPNHLERLLATAEETGADMVFPWFDVQGGTDPFPQHFGAPWDPADPHQTTITVLMRTETVRAAGGFEEPGDSVDGEGHRAGEDFRLVCTMNTAGAKIVHLPERTWLWNHWGGNTSGRPDRW